MNALWTVVLFIAIGLTAILIPTPGQSQARLTINNDAYVRMNGGSAGTPVYIVVDNGSANAVTTLGTGGNLVSEGEFNKLRWNIGTNTGTYTIPYTSNPSTTNTKFPLAVQITTAGAGAGLIDFSTYETTTDMNVPWASMVTHMTDADNVPADNSLFVVDRYWLMVSSAYTTKPDVNITFGYVDNAAELGGSNTIIEPNLVAQRWNDAIDEWEGDFSNTTISYGIDNAAANQVTGVDIIPSEFHEAWVLVDHNSLLPVELVSFEANCIDNQSVLTWSTASETNSSRFEIEKSFDGVTYFMIGMVNAAGNANQLTEYQFTDPTPFSATSYYRLKQIDLNGEYLYFSPASITSCEGLSSEIAIFTNENNLININWQASSEDEYVMDLISVDGKLIAQKNITTTEGFNHFEMAADPATGIYFLQIHNEQKQVSYKLFLK